MAESNEATIEEYADEKLREVATQVGLVAMEWNSIHNRLSLIFAKVTGLNYELASAIWNSIPNDGMQRDVLREATREVYKEREHQKFKKKINGLLEKLDKKKSIRDSFIHTPFAVLLEDEDLKVIPNDMANNRSAKRLTGEPDVRSTLNQMHRELIDLDRLAYEVLVDLPRAGIK